MTYEKTDWEVTEDSYRLLGQTISATCTVRDTWNDGNTLTTNTHDILVDTYDVSSSDLNDYFEDENQRTESDYVTPWNSQKVLVDGEAMVHNGRLQMPHTNWSPYLPTASNPDYSNLPSSASYYRNFPTANAITSYSGFSITVTGNFVSSLEDDLINEHLQIFVRRVNSNVGGNGVGSNPLSVHGQAYNNTLFDDGVTNGYIREFVSGNTISCTFGGAAMKEGVHFEIKIAHSSITLTSCSVSY